MAARLTQLEAVNTVLRMLGRMPVNSLAAADLTPDATIALAELDFHNRHVQLVGWYFNTELAVKLIPDVNGDVFLTDDVARVDNSKRYTHYATRKAITMRVDPDDSEMKLYDKLAASRDEDPYDFSDLPEVRVDLVRLLDFDHTPDSFRHYVTIKAGRATQARLVADQAQYRFSADDEARALQILMKEELDTSDTNFLNAPGVRQIVRRRSPLDWLEST
jgi:hypothetical protein